MYTIELSFKLNKSHNIERESEKIEYYLSALRKNGQILGKEQPLIHKNNTIRSYVYLPEDNSLDIKYSNKYVSKYSNEINDSGIKRVYKLIGKEFYSSEICQCSSSDSYILYTDFLTLEPPLRCGNCFGIIPLYKIPTTYDDEYYDIKCWESNYQACDALQMNCSVGEKFGIRQMSDYKSALNKDGLEICKNISNLTNKKFIIIYIVMYIQHQRQKSCIENVHLVGEPGF
jgi:predicted  nucleic acid-binding Zn ribbon protein